MFEILHEDIRNCSSENCSSDYFLGCSKISRLLFITKQLNIKIRKFRVYLYVQNSLLFFNANHWRQMKLEVEVGLVVA